MNGRADKLKLKEVLKRKAEKWRDQIFRIRRRLRRKRKKERRLCN